MSEDNLLLKSEGRNAENKQAVFRSFDRVDGESCKTVLQSTLQSARRQNAEHRRLGGGRSRSDSNARRALAIATLDLTRRDSPAHSHRTRNTNRNNSVSNSKQRRPLGTRSPTRSRASGSCSCEAHWLLSGPTCGGPLAWDVQQLARATHVARNAHAINHLLLTYGNIAMLK